MSGVKNLSDKYGDMLYLQLRTMRWTGRHMIKTQNIAEHHAIVAQLVIAILEEYNVPEKFHLLSIKRAVTHDMPEVITSDIPYVVKRDYPDFAKAYDKVESDVISDLPPPIKNCEVDKDTIPWLVVKLADSIDVCLFTEMEVDLGSRNKDTIEILEQSYARSEDIERKLLSALNKVSQD